MEDIKNTTVTLGSAIGTIQAPESAVATFGCEKCRGGTDSPGRPGILSGPLFTLSGNPEDFVFCDCKSGQALSAKIRESIQQDASEAITAAYRSQVKELFPHQGIPQEMANYTFKKWVSLVDPDDKGKQQLMAVVMNMYENHGRYVAPGEIKGQSEWAGAYPYGATGGGKTGGFLPLYMQFIKERAGLWIRFNDMLSLLKGGIEDQPVIQRRLRLLSIIPVLFIDELGNPSAHGEMTDTDKRNLFSVISARHDKRDEHGMTTIVTSNLTPDELTGVADERTVRRLLQMCAPVPVSGKPLSPVVSIAPWQPMTHASASHADF